MDYLELSIYTKDSVLSEILLAELSEAGFESFTENEEGIKAYIPEKQLNEDMLSFLRTYKQHTFRIETRKITKQNWNETWEKSFAPVRIDDFCCIHAPFHEEASGVRYNIVIEPKMSFGTGHHETTTLMVCLMSGLDFTAAKVLDMGCGTGILAILAGKMGADDIKAVDVDEWACINAQENALRNGQTSIQINQGDAGLLKNFPVRSFDVVLANINRNILIADLEEYSRLLKKGACLLLSGFYEEDKEMILQQARQFLLKEMRSLTKNKWVALELQKG